MIIGIFSSTRSFSIYKIKSSNNRLYKSYNHTRNDIINYSYTITARRSCIGYKTYNYYSTILSGYELKNYIDGIIKDILI
jgi:hypothetical protein